MGSCPQLPPTCSSGPVCTVPQPRPLPICPPSVLLHQGFSLCNSPSALLWDGQTLSLWVQCVSLGARVYPDSFLCQELGSSFCLPARAAAQRRAPCVHLKLLWGSILEWDGLSFPRLPAGNWAQSDLTAERHHPTVTRGSPVMCQLACV